eukprot:194941-Rhodomonas_salina.2
MQGVPRVRVIRGGKTGMETGTGHPGTPKLYPGTGGPVVVGAKLITQLYPVSRLSRRQIFYPGALRCTVVKVPPKNNGPQFGTAAPNCWYQYSDTTRINCQ